ncbi:sirohydrochlorin chelatase [Ruegeria conchae]|uniref:sirohydrochlorin chelatase n=1 Tax=Ruegeria conchae TaxID=981384 RepID=UPI0029C7712E|nr:CbiX/SirB N-terminal domain-containing protein [Ruegeria conchae]
MPHAVIVAHGQPSNPAPAEAALARFARQIDSLCHRVSVHSATLAAPDALETCLDELHGDIAIYPLFMAKGWFVTKALPKRLGSRSVRILDPLGIDPQLPFLVKSSLHQKLENLGWSASDTDLVIAAHGSGRSNNPASVADGFADTLGQLVTFKSTRTGFVEQSPSIAESASGCGEKALCLPFFACTGGHVLEDVPQELARANFAGQVMPVISELPQVEQHIAAILDAI